MLAHLKPPDKTTKLLKSHCILTGVTLYSYWSHIVFLLESHCILTSVTLYIINRLPSVCVVEESQLGKHVSDVCKLSVAPVISSAAGKNHQGERRKILYFDAILDLLKNCKCICSVPIVFGKYAMI